MALLGKVLPIQTAMGSAEDDEPINISINFV